MEEAGKSSPPPPADEKYLRLSSPDPGRCCRREPSRPPGPDKGNQKLGGEENPPLAVFHFYPYQRQVGGKRDEEKY